MHLSTVEVAKGKELFCILTSERASGKERDVYYACRPTVYPMQIRLQTVIGLTLTEQLSEKIYQQYQL